MPLPMHQAISNPTPSLDGEDPGLTAFKAAHPHLDPSMAETVYKQAVKPGGAPAAAPAQPMHNALVNPYENLANKATGRNYE